MYLEKKHINDTFKFKRDRLVVLSNDIFKFIALADLLIKRLNCHGCLYWKYQEDERNFVFD